MGSLFTISRERYLLPLTKIDVPILVQISISRQTSLHDVHAIVIAWFVIRIAAAVRAILHLCYSTSTRRGHHKLKRGKKEEIFRRVQYRYDVQYCTVVIAWFVVRVTTAVRAILHLCYCTATGRGHHKLKRE